jgi:hypothetical protein
MEALRTLREESLKKVHIQELEDADGKMIVSEHD